MAAWPPTLPGAQARVRYNEHTTRTSGVPTMKVLQVIGALLIAAGLYVLVKGATYPSEKSLFKVGGVEAKIEQHHDIPPWVGGVGIAAGVVLVVVGIGKRSA
jgi:hypothetical protein